MNKSNFIIFKGVIGLLILAMINVSLDLSYYSFRLIASDKTSVTEVDVNSVAELVLEVGLDLEDQEINDEQEEQPVKPQKPFIKLVPGNWFMQLALPDKYAEMNIIPFSLKQYSSFFVQDSPPPRI